VPADRRGQSRALHASGGNLGAYWFTKKHNRWFKTAEQASFAWTGFFGDVGYVRSLLLAGGKTVISVENGSCWQGQCGQWLTLFELEDGRVRSILDDDFLMIHSDSIFATEVCEELLKAPSPTTMEANEDEYSTVVGCYDITGKWSIEPIGNFPNDLVVQYSGKRTHHEHIANDAPLHYRLTTKNVDTTLVMRYINGRYTRILGVNPAPPI
jgi:hypothetical protein